MRNVGLALVLVLMASLHGACSASDSKLTSTGSGAGSTGSGGDGGGINDCDTCFGNTYNPCDGPSVECPDACSPGLGCTECVAGATLCMGNDVHECSDDGTVGGFVETCDPAAGLLCSEGACKTRCEVAEESPSNVGCEFWAVDLDQVDAGNDPASMPFGVALANASDAVANVTIEINEAPQGSPPDIQVVTQVSVPPGQLEQVTLPIRELDCGVMPNDYSAPGTCLSSQAFRISSSAPIVVYQFNVFENAFSNDASLLLPSNALGQSYRAINWSAGHPAPIDLPIPGVPVIIDRSYVTIVGIEEGTQVTVVPSWRIKGNDPIPAAQPGETISVTLGPFDVLNLETDDATLQEAGQVGVADLTGTTIESNKPVAVFSGVESTSAPYHVDVPTHSGWTSEDTCCLDHLEEQLFPLESIGMEFFITRSPVRSTGSYQEPDVLRFVGAAEPATVTTNLPAPLDSFTLDPGQVVDTWADEDVVVTSTAPVLVGQLLISQEYVDGPYKGDPSLTVFPPVEQYRTEYVILTPGSWLENWVVIAAEVGANVTIDGSAPTGCVTGNNVVSIDGTDYQARRCPLTEGVHSLSGDKPFGIVAYGYGSAGSYAFAGGADVEAIYEVPPLR